MFKVETNSVIIINDTCVLIHLLINNAEVRDFIKIIIMTITNKIAGVFAGVAAAVVAFMMIASSASAMTVADFGPSTLKVGSTGMYVANMQSALNMASCANAGLVADGKFGPMTGAKVQAFQASKGLTADGFVGNATKAALATCSTTTSTPSTPSTGSNNSSSLSGGAGDLEDVDILSTYSSEDVLEGANDAKVMAFEIEADNGSDLLIQNVRLAFEMTGAGSSRMDKYMDSVKVWQANDEVGSADEDEFSENSDIYSKSIALDGAVVEDGEKSKFYVSVDAISNIDSDDLNENWTVTLESIRFMDADGAIITDNSTGEIGDSLTFSFEDLTSSGDLELKATKDNSSPEAQVVEVDDVSDTNDVLLLAVKLKATGSDFTFDEMEFDVTPTGANTNEIVKEYRLIVDGDEIDSMGATSIASTVTGQITFTDLEDDFMVEEGDTIVVELVADINDLEGNFGGGDSIVASFTNTNFLASEVDDQEGDSLANGDRSGSVVGESQTFFKEGIVVELVGSPTAVKTVGDASAPESDSGLFSITFDVTAFGSDVFIDKSAPLAAGGSGESDLTITGTGSVTSEISSVGADEGTDGFEVADGTTERFTITTNILATATGFFRVQLGSLAYALTDADATTYYSSDLEDFKTPSISLTDR